MIHVTWCPAWSGLTMTQAISEARARMAASEAGDMSLEQGRTLGINGSFESGPSYYSGKR